ncbi:MAG: hypothetical protein ABIF10_07705 [Candidatus Woesearchaeota archaeon]
MRISFYEEFPTKENLEKLKIVTFPSQVFIAAKCVREYLSIVQTAKTYNKNTRFGYWPVLEIKDGYWISPFSEKAALDRIIEGILSCKKRLDVVWDSELPVLRPWLFAKNLFSAPGAKRKILDFCNHANNRLFITENVFVGSTWLAKLLGVYSVGIGLKYKTLMFYSSMMPPGVRFLSLRRIAKEKKLVGQNLSVAVGVIAHGIHGREPILSPAALDCDLKDLKVIGIDHVFVFRLGGLNKEYVRIIKKYVS